MDHDQHLRTQSAKLIVMLPQLAEMRPTRNSEQMTQKDQQQGLAPKPSQRRRRSFRAKQRIITYPVTNLQGHEMLSPKNLFDATIVM